MGNSGRILDERRKSDSERKEKTVFWPLRCVSKEKGENKPIPILGHAQIFSDYIMKGNHMENRGGTQVEEGKSQSDPYSTLARSAVSGGGVHLFEFQQMQEAVIPTREVHNKSERKVVMLGKGGKLRIARPQKKRGGNLDGW